MKNISNLKVLLPILFMQVCMNVWGQKATITISNAATSGGSWSLTTPDVFNPSANIANIDYADIETKLATGDVTINTDFINGIGNGNVTLLHNLTATGTNTLTINGNYLIIDASSTLTLNPASRLTVNGNIENNGTFNLKSGSTGTATLVNSGTFTGSGTCNAEQYITGNGPLFSDSRWWYFGSPLTNATSVAYGSAANNQVRTYTEPLGFEAFNLNNSTPIIPMQGYYTRTIDGPKTVNFSGSAFNAGPLSINVTRTSPNPSYEGYNFISNPYAAYLDFNQILLATLANPTVVLVQPTYWVRTHNGTLNKMVFDYFNKTGNTGTSNSGGPALTQYIAPMQTFWVKATPDLTTTFPFSVSSSMTSHQGNGTIKSNLQPDLVRLNLSNETGTDQTVVYFNEQAVETFDAFDSEKRIESAFAQIYTMADSTVLVINGLGSPKMSPVVELYMNISIDTVYTLNATEIKMDGFRVFLEDKILSVLHDLTQIREYTFSAEAGFSQNRFALHFVADKGLSQSSSNTVDNPLKVEEQKEATINIYNSNGKAMVMLSNNHNPAGEIFIYDLMGRIVQTQKINGNINMVPLNDLHGIFIVKVQTEKQVVSQKIFNN
jgi:trimeric autotransporter adhesin